MNAWLRRFVPIAAVLIGITAAVDASQWPGMLLLAAGIASAISVLERIDNGRLPAESSDVADPTA